MHFLGYLVTLANLHTLSGGSPNNMSIRVGTLQSIAEEVRNLPVPLDGFRKNGYQRFDSIGIYLSKNVQDYLFYNQGQPDDEGLMLTLYFNGDKEAENTGASYFYNIHFVENPLTPYVEPSTNAGVRKKLNQNLPIKQKH
ncbi:hypothetical protein NE865_09837 [Phthorimaea operculella]|nr:hypothetical protein NE865_09837 [Phthorimaea operculella]